MKRRFLILAEGSFDPQSSKTANAAIRYIPDEVVAVLDSTCTATHVQSVLGFGGDIPVVATLEEGLSRRPNALLIGIAPQGGQLPDSWRVILSAALENGMEIWNGLHTRLGTDPQLSQISQRTGTRIHDLRTPPENLDVAHGLVRDLDATVVLTVGTDCNIGKMTTQVQIRGAVEALSYRVAFGATGQTGILLEGSGIAVDAVVADFIAGAAERLTIEAARKADAEIVLVEGQGSVFHPSYSGVTVGLLHGSMPHAMVLCAQPTRKAIKHQEWVQIPPLADVIRVYELLATPLRAAKVIAVALNTWDLSDDDARAAIREAERETGLPVTDPVRYGPDAIATAISEFHKARVAAAG